MAILAKKRQDVRNYINKNIGDIVCIQDFSNPNIATTYLRGISHEGITERIKPGEYKILKKDPYTPPSRTVPAKNSKEMREYINQRVGKTISTKDFVKRNMASAFLCVYAEKGFVERVGWSKYKILKKIELKKVGPKKGIKLARLYKDVSTIPLILNSSDEGLVVSQIILMYNNITPTEKRVNSNYMYRLIGFARNNGVIKIIGENADIKTNNIGPNPKRLALVNPNITSKEWEEVVSQYRLFYQYKKENKLKKKPTEATVVDRFKDSKDIINAFNEDRVNLSKQFVEEHFINLVHKFSKGIRMNCFAITGPDYFRHTLKLFNRIANRLTICELNPAVFDTIYKKAQTCPFYIDGKVSLLNCNVDDISLFNAQYIDLDLMSSLGSIYDSVTKQVKNQDLNCDSKNLKFISFTTSIRNDGGANSRLILLQKLLFDSFNMKLDGFQGSGEFGDGIALFNGVENLKYCLKRMPEISKWGRVKGIYILTYQDYAPMLSALIVYK